MCEPRLKIVTAGTAKLDDEILGIAVLTTPTMRSPQLCYQIAQNN